MRTKTTKHIGYFKQGEPYGKGRFIDYEEKTILDKRWNIGAENGPYKKIRIEFGTIIKTVFDGKFETEEKTFANGWAQKKLTNQNGDVLYDFTEPDGDMTCVAVCDDKPYYACTENVIFWKEPKNAIFEGKNC